MFWQLCRKCRAQRLREANGLSGGQLVVAPPLVGGGWILYYFHNRQIVVTPPIGGKGMIIDGFSKIILIMGEWVFS